MNILSEDIDIDNDPEALKKSKDFYESCIDVGKYNKYINF